ncbi:MAG: hypothetical protein Q8K45_14125 [Rubrivivax sp.]|nr:hypothetical protein [Rubrivivax sp.]
MNLNATADAASPDSPQPETPQTDMPQPGARNDTALSELMTQGTVATSFGTFKPVGHVMVGLPDAEHADAAVQAFHQAGWAPASLLHFAPGTSVSELSVLVDGAGPLADFGYELRLLRRYLALSRQGCRWLLVKVDGVEHAAKAAELARRQGAVLAVHYRLLTVDELL